MATPVITRTVFSQGIYLISAEQFQIQVASATGATLNGNRILTSADLATNVNTPAHPLTGTLITAQTNRGVPVAVGTNFNIRSSTTNNKTFVAIPAFSISFNGNPLTVTFSAPLPVGYRPTFPIYASVEMLSNGSPLAGYLTVDTSGNMTLSNNAGGFSTTLTFPSDVTITFINDSF